MKTRIPINSNEPRKELTTIKGRKVMLLWRPHRKKAVIEYYEPSKAYHDHVRQLRTTIEALKKNGPIAQKIQINEFMTIHSKNYSLMVAINMFNKIIPVIDDSIQDEWLKDQGQLQAAWIHPHWDEKLPDPIKLPIPLKHINCDNLKLS